MDKANMMVKAIEVFVDGLNERGVLKNVRTNEMTVGVLIDLMKDYPGDWLKALAEVRIRGAYHASEPDRRGV